MTQYLPIQPCTNRMVEKAVQVKNGYLFHVLQNLHGRNCRRSVNVILFWLLSWLSLFNIDLDNFVYTAPHDLKSPIANLEGITSLLVKK